MADVINIDAFRSESKKQRVKDWFSDKTNRTVNWINNNKEIVVVLIPVACGAVRFGTKAIVKHVNLNKQQDLKELYCYDRSLGHYWKLRRELSNAEWIEIDKRKRNGERLGDILEELKVLK